MLNKEQIQQRRESIVKWLSSDGMKVNRREFRNGNGFSVSSRVNVSMNGQVLPVTEYLRREGFKDGVVVGEYRMQVNPATEQYVESFAFFLTAPVKELPALSGNGNRQAEIVAWLRSESMKDAVRVFRDNRGFSVSERTRVNVGGQAVTMTTFLKNEGFVEGAVISEYRIKVNPANDRFPENLSFFLNSPVVAVPEF